MNPLPIRIAALAAALAAVVAVVARRRYQPQAFLPYLVTVLTWDALVNLWPAVFFTRPVWIVQQTVYGVLRFIVAFELAGSALRGFQGAAQRWAGLVGLTLLATTLAAALWTPVPTVSCEVHDPLECALYETFYFSTVPRIVNATIWVFTWTAILVRGFGLPMTRWERAVTIGMAIYLAVFATSLGAVARFGWASQPVVVACRAVAWIALCVSWAVAALKEDATSEQQVLALRERVAARA